LVNAINEASEAGFVTATSALAPIAVFNAVIDVLRVANPVMSPLINATTEPSRAGFVPAA